MMTVGKCCDILTCQKSADVMTEEFDTENYSLSRSNIEEITGPEITLT